MSIGAPASLKLHFFVDILQQLSQTDPSDLNRMRAHKSLVCIDFYNFHSKLYPPRGLPWEFFNFCAHVHGFPLLGG